MTHSNPVDASVGTFQQGCQASGKRAVSRSDSCPRCPPIPVPEMVSVGVRLIFPAQLIRMATLPNVGSEAANGGSMEARLQTSELSHKVRRPRLSISAAVASCSNRRAEATTSAPASARPRLNTTDAGGTSNHNGGFSLKSQNIDRHSISYFFSSSDAG